MQQVNYRPVTEDEIHQAIGDLNSLAFYASAKRVADQLYGNNWHKLDVDISGEYNDEGGTNYYVSSISATDAMGNDSEFDLTTEWWMETMDNGYGRERYERLIAEDESDASYLVEECFYDDISDLRHEIYIADYEYAGSIINGEPPKPRVQLFTAGFWNDDGTWSPLV